MAEATAVAGLGSTAEPTDVDTFPSGRATAIHNRYSLKANSHWARQGTRQRPFTRVDVHYRSNQTHACKSTVAFTLSTLTRVNGRRAMHKSRQV